MKKTEIANAMGFHICQKVPNASFIDGNDILWKVVNGEWIGKHSVWTKDWKCKWLEDTSIDNVEAWWCGRNADYSEIFRK